MYQRKWDGISKKKKGEQIVELCGCVKLRMITSNELTFIAITQGGTQSRVINNCWEVSYLTIDVRKVDSF